VSSRKDGEIIVKGESPNEGAVTRFGQSMEFSSGLFTNLNIETERKTAEAKTSMGAAAAPAAPASNVNIPGVPMPEVVAFTIKCSYAGAKPPEPVNNTASAPKPGANNVAARN
jgi:hypothetical protein